MIEAIDHGRTGLLGRRMDDLELADATSTLLGDGSMRAGMGTAARERALTLFDLHVQAGKYIELYQERLDARLS